MPRTFPGSKNRCCFVKTNKIDKQFIQIDKKFVPVLHPQRQIYYVSFVPQPKLHELISFLWRALQ